MEPITQLNQAHGKLVTKLVRVMAAIDHVDKRGRNDKQNYDFVRAADLYHELRRAFIEQNVFMTHDVVTQERWTQPTQSGGTMNFCSLKVAFTFHDGETGVMIGPVHGCGWGMDTGDKAPYKAMTGALKYAGRTNFMVPDDSDPEQDSVPKARKVERSEERPTSQSSPAPRPARTTGTASSIPQQHGRGKGSKPVTQAQLGRLFAIANGRGVPKDDIERYSAEMFHVTSLKELNMSDYDRVISWIEAQA